MTEYRFVETDNPQKCPYCEKVIEEFEYRQVPLKLGFLTRRTVIVVSCSHCNKVLTASTLGGI